MKRSHVQRRAWRRAVPLAILAGLCLAGWQAAQAARIPVKSRSDDSEDARTDYKAYEMLKKGRELLEMKQEERGVKLLQSIPEMFGESKIRFQAYLALGSHFLEEREYDRAVKQFKHVEESENPDERAEALYQTGICYYSMNNFDKAFVVLRRVTNDYPWSVYANEAFYYIGQCHFKLGRWAKAVQALQMVGTSVPPDIEGDVKAEAGQRLYVKINDKDLVVLLNTDEPLTVELTTRRGDKETIELELLGQSGENYIGSLPCEPAVPSPGDGRLQIVGGDKVDVAYEDENTESGKRFEKKTSTIDLVSTATAGFTDGAFQEYVQGVFGDADCFLRVRDLDQDTSDGPDRLNVKVITRYKVEKEDRGALYGGFDLSGYGDEYEMRDSVTVILVETGPHTGLFTGSIVPQVIRDDAAVNQGDSILSAMQGDDVVIEYYDERHMLGPDSRIVKAQAKMLVGEIQDVKIEHRVVDSMDLRARKNLIEARIFLKLAAIFKDVGLVDKANEKADQGLERVEDVIAASLSASLERSIVEEAFSVKWDLLLVQDRLNEAIDVCRTLTRLFPDSTLVDQALLRIGQAKMEENAEEPREAIQIFSAIIQLPKSELKAEAQYHIALAYEKWSEKRGINDLSRALLAYKKCAETYPDSPFAGESLDKIASFYISSRDYVRAIELMEQVCRDYPDASFLDNMLWKWIVAAFRIGNYEMAYEKSQQLLADYPNSNYADKVRQYQDVIAKRMGSSR